MRRMIFPAALIAGVALLLGVHAASAQTAPAAPVVAPLPDLTYTMPSGKVLTFQTSESKEKFLAGLERMRTAPANPALVPVAIPGGPTKPVAPGSPGAGQSRSGIPNLSSPIFTADYYLGADPESWVGKNVTLSVCYLRPMAGAPLVAGLRPLMATTANKLTGKTAELSSGGRLMILTTQEQAQRLLALCGTRSDAYTNDPAPERMTLIHGEFGKPASEPTSATAQRKYCLYVK